MKGKAADSTLQAAVNTFHVGLPRKRLKWFKWSSCHLANATFVMPNKPEVIWRKPTFSPPRRSKKEFNDTLTGRPHSRRCLLSTTSLPNSKELKTGLQLIVKS
ncbi:hypothetical protein M514_07641 [Trichuris suis]|uniref:Uncharacterized protein n=1 Tax=Trichuris suis TaxID=68888 RepID=A0A085M2I2_9BILA|nr:hypothetical protein M513_07641 [Trichuris suis]KFD65756.1 hypothetical protein M514_07641 [Trichuris suis]